MREKVLVVGLGEVGIPLYEIIKESGKYDVYGFDVDEKKMKKLNQSILPKRFDIIHICIGCTDMRKFCHIASGYAKKYKPYLLIINSTVPPKTTEWLYAHLKSRKCKCLLAHSPIFGTHKGKKYMKWEIRRWTKLVGGIDRESSKATKKHFAKVGIKTYVTKSPVEAELIKTMGTSYTASMITFFQEFHRIASYFDADFDEIVGRFAKIHERRGDAPIWYPDFIGGHCIMQNIDLLLQCYDSELLNLIKKSNEMCKKEMKRGRIRKEVRKIRQRYERFWEKYRKTLNKRKELYSDENVS